MTHYFISAYYNYFEDPERERLCKEFIERYPHVLLYEIAYGDRPFKINAPNTVKYRYPNFLGFINNRIMNDFIRTRNDIASVTFLDSDIEVEPFFFRLLPHVIESHGDEPVFIQPFDIAIEKHKNPKIISPPVTSSAKNLYDGNDFSQYVHTGYVYTFNKAALDQIKFFPEEMVLGGFDTFLHLSLYKQKDFIKSLIKDPILQKILLAFYERIQGVKVDFMKGVVRHHEHGNKFKRYDGRFELYNKGVTEESVKKYFQERDNH